MSLTFDEVLGNLQRAFVEGVQLAGEFLAGQMIELVAIQCDFEHHSPVGGPPYKETGLGQASIGSERIENGIRVGVSTIEEDPARNRSYELDNHLWFHDPLGGGQRPWISTWPAYWPEMQTIIEAVLKTHSMAAT
jgi:hypothetical protein